ncbi:hypothetical protein BO70DRAFT_28135 [Aspergillus heteromorphus CBS 117.55]|uniref:Uncharacterized protein n=1 Tax=Aspergillus heteromorphus CBS 117.55 TaxID=1448321 RepID=A0A317WAK7_9EURO|nr:uncharacterized protein BO70DRAFT_28135 [Aspergillus heteromorphus CBS 117.55]PWY83544.1 hypothetical protein BO70DRAFT_28135 [Aspergillus heteromorphus CBS 117.55]
MNESISSLFPVSTGNLHAAAANRWPGNSRSVTPLDSDTCLSIVRFLRHPSPFPSSAPSSLFPSFLSLPLSSFPPSPFIPPPSIEFTIPLILTLPFPFDFPVFRSPQSRAATASCAVGGSSPRRLVSHPHHQHPPRPHSSVCSRPAIRSSLPPPPSSRPLSATQENKRIIRHEPDPGDASPLYYYFIIIIAIIIIID